jgi:hypothetical protein
MTCLVQFYFQVKEDIAPHRPLLKVLCIKLVIFVCFWQEFVISLLTTEGGAIKETVKIKGPDLRIGVPAILVCFEMAIFSVLHFWAFPWKPYDLSSHGIDDSDLTEPQHYAYGPLHAFLAAWNPWDIVKALSRGSRWLFIGRRQRMEDPSYSPYFAGLDVVGDGLYLTRDSLEEGNLRTGVMERKEFASARDRCASWKWLIVVLNLS